MSGSYAQMQQHFPATPIVVLSNPAGAIVLCYSVEEDATESLCENPIVMRPVDGGCLLMRCGRVIGIAPAQSLSALITARQVNIGYSDNTGVHFVGEVTGRIRFAIGGN